jgi:hypothetical protein
MQEGQRCPHCEEGILQEKLKGDYDYLQCDKCYKTVAHTIGPELERHFKSEVKEKRDEKNKYMKGKYW